MTTELPRDVWKIILGFLYFEEAQLNFAKEKREQNEMVANCAEVMKYVAEVVAAQRDAMVTLVMRDETIPQNVLDGCKVVRKLDHLETLLRQFIVADDR